MTNPTNADATRPVAIDLFAGAGGLSLGFEMGGFDILAAVEYDPVHAGTHAYNFPSTPVLCRDVRRVTADELLLAARRGWELHNPGSGEWDGVVDVVIGGPSCQGFSTMGKQIAADDRNQLVSEFVRLVEAVRPRAFVMENVPGILSAQFERILDDATTRLLAAGYCLNDYAEPLDSTLFGVPQRRKRVVIIGILGDKAPAKIEPMTSEPVVVRDALAGLPSLAGRRQVDGELLELDDAQYSKYVGTRNIYLESLTSAGSRHELEPSRVLSGCLVTEHRPQSIARFEKLGQGSTDAVSRTWRLDEDAPARTLRAGTGRERGSFSAARPLHPREPRVITVREAARLHSFPDWFRFHATNWHGHRQIGNAVPPLLAKAAARAVAASLGVDVGKAYLRPSTKTADARLLSMSPTGAADHFNAAVDEIPMSRARALFDHVSRGLIDIPVTHTRQ